MAGHSRWAQIKHKKAVADAQKGRLFSKLVREIMLAVRTAGPNPETNLRLRSAIEQARSAGLPGENIERAISRASGKGEEENLQEFLYEASAPGGLLAIIEVITDNKNRALADIKKVLTERGGKLNDPGSVIWNFDKIGVLTLTQADNPGKKDEEIELAIIESGAKDFRWLDGTCIVETEFKDLDKVRRNLEENGLVIEKSEYDYKPKAELVLNSPAKEEMEKLLDALTDLDDVKEVYTNLTTHDSRNTTREV
jgi:YebC/PmpR family DNA-binding regulatory protein